MSHNVLIVDDSVSMHELIKMHLSDEPWTLHSAYDGAAGLKMASVLAPDAILLDVDMPEMNGFDVCRALKAAEQTARIAVIFLTACASADEKICGLELRAADYITKPFDPPELCARLRAALRTKRLLDMLPEAAFDPAHIPSDHREGGPMLVNARLTMKQMLKARSANPWDRTPPRPVPVAAETRVSA